jgi:kinesin family member 15
LFVQIARETRRSNGEIKFTCKSSFFEIFNERVFDLLDSANTDTHSSVKDRQSSDRNSRGSRNSSSTIPDDLGGLQVREDKSRVYVDGLNETEVSCTADAIKVLQKGYRNRRVAETAMNRESSRSHAVFQLQVKSEDQTNPAGKRKSSLFTLVDLAGSERQSGTSASGDRLKEANSINKSLSVLGQVINALVDRGQGKPRHVPYRDSKLCKCVNLVLFLSFFLSFVFFFFCEAYLYWCICSFSVKFLLALSMLPHQRLSIFVNMSTMCFFFFLT